MLSALRRDERGFSIMELMVVVVIIAIVLGVSSTSIRSTLLERPNAELDVVTARVWRAVGDYRLDHGGAFPTAANVTRTGLVNTSGGRYLRTWPEHPGKGTPFAVTASTATAPPDTATKFTVLYRVNSTATSAWIAAYDHRGRIMFRRGTSESTATAASSNDPSAVVPLG